MNEEMKREIPMVITEQERMSLQIVAVEYLKSIAKYEAENKGEDKLTVIIKETLQSSVKKLETAKLEAEDKKPESKLELV